MKNILLLNGGKRLPIPTVASTRPCTKPPWPIWTAVASTCARPSSTAAMTSRREVDKFLWADVVIYQMPGWWMGAHGR